MIYDVSGRAFKKFTIQPSQAELWRASATRIITRIAYQHESRTFLTKGRGVQSILRRIMANTTEGKCQCVLTKHGLNITVGLRYASAVGLRNVRGQSTIQMP
jgi:hypothetical protein